MSYRFGVDIGATRTMFALVEENSSHIVAHDRPNTEVILTGSRAPCDALAGAMERFLAGRDLTGEDLLGVGVGVPGTVEHETGRVLTCPNLRLLDGADLGSGVAERLGVPVWVDNNTNLIALGEHAAGIAQGMDNVAVVFVGSGVGCGLILNGELYRGSGGLAGELGHTSVVPNGLLCDCGGRGCVEMYCSGKALSTVAGHIFEPRELFDLGTRFDGARLVIDQAVAGHDRARRAMVQAFTYLGYALANLAVLLSPEAIVLGGGVVKAWPEGVDVVSRVIDQAVRIGGDRKLEILQSRLQDFAGVLGGATLVAQCCARGN